MSGKRVTMGSVGTLEEAKEMCVLRSKIECFLEEYPDVWGELVKAAEADPRAVSSKPMTTETEN